MYAHSEDYYELMNGTYKLVNDWKVVSFQVDKDSYGNGNILLLMEKES